MEVIGFDAEAAQQQALTAVLGLLLALTFVAPVGGMVLHRVIRRFVPTDEFVVLLGTAFIIFIMSFALMLGVLLRVPLFAGLSTPLMLLISLFAAAMVTSITAMIVRALLRRDARRLKPDVHRFGVWEEDARQRPRNLRRK